MPSWPLGAPVTRLDLFAEHRLARYLDMAMLMLLRRMKVEGAMVHGFHSTFRDWASEVANAPHEVAEMSLSHKVGRYRQRCGAKTRKGHPCKMMSEAGKRRCKYHGGMSTGPKTPEGKARIAEAQRKRWVAWRKAHQDP